MRIARRVTGVVDNDPGDAPSWDAPRESEEWRRAVLQSAMDGFWLTDLDGRLIEVNTTYCRMSGYSEAELLGMNVRDLEANERPGDTAAHLARIRERGEDRFLTRHRRRDGSAFPVEVGVKYHAFAGGRMVVFVHDMTAREIALAALAENAYFFQESQRAAHVGSYKLDFSTGGWKSSAVLDEIFGIDAAFARDISGWVVLIHPDDRAMMQRYLEEEVIGKRRSFNKDYRIVRQADGEVRWVSGLGALTVDDGGTPVLLTGTIRDITELKDAEAVLRLEGAALNAAANVIMITDRDGITEWANPAFAASTGYATAEAFGHTPGELLRSGVHDTPFYQRLWQTILAGEVWRGEMTNRRKDGTIFIEDTTITPLTDDAGAVTHFIAVKQDITERKQLEEQYRQAQKMESVGRLAGGVAHDFNNMLVVILGHLDLALAEVDPSLQLYADLREVYAAAQRSADLTRQLLAFARKQPVVPRHLQLDEQISQSLRLLQRLIGEDVQLAWRPGADTWPILMDPSQLDQILTNLCVNARDAINGVGTLALATTNCVIDAAFCARHPEATPGDFVRLRVTDSGAGMSDDVAARIFDPFFTTKPAGAGTGLGLSTVYGAVRQNGGYITVRSVLGEGSMFDLYLPRHTEAPVERPAAVPHRPTPAGHECVLIVEDEAAILRMTSRCLTGLGYVVLGAQRADDALDLARAHPGSIHLMLTDVVMPHLNGRDLAERISPLQPGMKCLFMSGYTADVIAGNGVVDDDAHFLAKPFSLASLGVKVRAVLDAP